MSLLLSVAVVLLRFPSHAVVSTMKGPLLSWHLHSHTQYTAQKKLARGTGKGAAYLLKSLSIGKHLTTLLEDTGSCTSQLYCIIRSSSHCSSSTRREPFSSLRRRPVTSCCTRAGSSEAEKLWHGGAIIVLATVLMDAALGSRALGDVEEASFEEVSEKHAMPHIRLPQRIVRQKRKLGNAPHCLFFFLVVLHSNFLKQDMHAQF